MANFDLSNLALQAVCPGNEILYDDKGMPSIMVKIPKMTYAQLGLGVSTATHPAFIINGSEVPHIYISKYQNIVKNGRAYSLPGQDPAASMNFETAMGYCTAKGSGWHLMTRAEWALIALWCKANATLPYGNNDYGKDSRETVYKAIPTLIDSGTGKINRVATGTGPLTWSHDRTVSGIWDLNGNVSEWVGGIRTVYGELQVLANNNAADFAKSQLVGSSEWKAIDGTTGELVTPNGTGTTTNSLKLDWLSNHWEWITGSVTWTGTYQSCTFETVTAHSSVVDAAKLLLQALGLFKYDATGGVYEGDYLYADCVAAERSFRCGGHWHGGANGGVFCADGSNTRSLTNAGIGFRSAFVTLPTV